MSANDLEGKLLLTEKLYNFAGLEDYILLGQFTFVF